jgi:hypothetical protein
MNELIAALEAYRGEWIPGRQRPVLDLMLNVLIEVARWEAGLCAHADNADVCDEWRQSDLGRANAALHAHLVDA